MCGEYVAHETHSVIHKGSPPRVRGILTYLIKIIERLRITPACAGNTPCRRGRSLPSRDHPRVCGEYVKRSFLYAKIWGSPPRVRGIPVPDNFRGLHPGITPACAGNTVLLMLDCGLRRDHPRVCGEYLLSMIGRLTSKGSPPRVRGIHIRTE